MGHSLVLRIIIIILDITAIDLYHYCVATVCMIYITILSLYHSTLLSLTYSMIGYGIGMRQNNRYIHKQRTGNINDLT